MSDKNGVPHFNFRKRGYRDEIRLSRLQVEINHLGKQIDNLPVSSEVDGLLDVLQDKEMEALKMIVSIVEYLPDDYLREGITSDTLNFEDVSAIIDSLRYGVMDQLALEMAEARRNYSKNSIARLNSQ